MIKVLLIFALILFLGRWKWPMGPVLLIASLLLGLWFQMSLKQTLLSMLNSAFASQTLFLCFNIFFILILSIAMKEGGQLQRIVSTFSSVMGNGNLSMACLPAIIGLLPMPGGAVFSAPMVEAASRETTITPQVKAAANYWFRHVWEYWWPLYPGVIMVISLTNIQLTEFILRQIPLTLLALGLGFLLILKDRKGESKINFFHGKKFVWEISPILLVIALILVLRRCFNINQNLSLLISLVISITWVCFMNRISFNKIAKLVFDKANLSMFILGIGIMVFREILGDSHALEGIKQDLSSYGIPSLLMIMFLPFLAGLVTGITVGFVGASFPLVISILPGEPGSCIQYVILAYGCGYLGVLFSPVHICLVLTRDYFKVSLVKIYREILLPLLLLFGGLSILFFLYGGI